MGLVWLVGTIIGYCMFIFPGHLAPMLHLPFSVDGAEEYGSVSKFDEVSMINAYEKQTWRRMVKLLGWTIAWVGALVCTITVEDRRSCLTR